MAESSNVAELIGKFSSHDGVVRQQAREQLVAVGKPAVAPLAEALGDSHKQVRWEAAKALEQISDPEAAPQLAVALGDEESDVRWVAGEALIALKRQALVPVLDAVSTKPDSVWMFDGVHHVLRELAKDNEVQPILAPVIKALSTPTIDEREIIVPVEAQKAAEKLRKM
ncbi:MAG: HEAT repeat domain-containing protein [Pirellulaceae bacterium]